LNVQFISMNTFLYTDSWLSDIRFIAGLALFLFGFVINRYSDYILYRIRQHIQQEYAIPQSGLYRFISCPNYFGEILIWVGWTLATWSPVAAAFTLWSIANLAPRARSHHRWYKEQFEDYPEERHILVPWIW
jgi:3-oxo-5-alpha-steroid 4-dehydrogenase 1